MRPLDPRLLRHARATRTFLVLSVALGVALAGLVVAQATLLASLITSVFLDGAAVGPAAVAPLAVVVLLRAAVAWAQQVVATRAAAAVKRELRARLLAHAAALGPGRAPTSATLATLATRGLDALDAYFAKYLPQLVLAALVPVVVLVRLAPADLVATATVALTLPLIPVFMALVGLHTESANRRQFRLLTRLSHHFLDVVAGLPTLRVFGRAKRQAAVIAEISAEQRRVTMRTLRVALLSSLVLELLSTLSVALVAVGIGLRLVDGSLGLATALLVLILAPEAYLPLRQVGANYHASAEGLAAATDVFAILETPLPAAARTSADAPIRFSDVVVAYPGRPPLPAFSCAVAPGELVALTGPSGCGKSTVLSVLMGFVTPTAGTVSPLPALRDVAWLPQRPWLGAGTIADNICLGAAGRDPAAMRSAAAQAGALSFIEALPDGFDTPLGDDGAGLSAGQRQRIALARVFLRDAPLVLLDEPTAGLDAATEAELLAAIRAHAAGRTVIMAAHRPSLVAIADRVIALPSVTPAPAGVAG
ncbi:thiol reductant ABC exporter subunit CydD [Dactylosporangium vinaceum]|uniref:Thiol reductant ABC exporter subunit CydD n=1 Tax=Dactylosporangium vinaceum TaxID=53362 RepID=A0ABV5MA37_9ACTN|nr:thiol reductant ABC exporter subunit CydD [Dactylosporangium vinaceum]UAB93107.1 thiol reductant ABC exporter subunit CydD [Dactylosporangium vinaceum]